LAKDGFISHLTYLVQLPYLGKSQNSLFLYKSIVISHFQLELVMGDNTLHDGIIHRVRIRESTDMTSY